ALEFAPERNRRVADIRERPPRLESHVDVDPATARGLREPSVAKLAEQRAGLGGDADRVLEVGPGLRVEVESQFVGMVDVVASDGPGVKGDCPHLCRPPDDCDLGGANLVCGAAGRGLNLGCLHVVGRAARNALLEEGVTAALLAGREHDPGMYALGQRSSVVGRRLTARMIPSPTAR